MLMLLIYVPEAVAPRFSVKNVLFKILQNSQKNACVRVCFNKVADLKKTPPIQVFSCEICEIFKNDFF